MSDRVPVKKHEAEEFMRIMLDAVPLSCSLWTRDHVNMDCNQAAIDLFELSSKQEFAEHFFELSPKYQPDGRLSSEKMAENLQKVFETGKVCIEWMHQTIHGEPIPAEITLVRVAYGDDYVVASYTRDLRAIKVAEAERREVEERQRLMFEGVPLCCNLLTRDLVSIDCNQEAINLFEASSKQECLDRFAELSPEYQPDGRLSTEKAMENVRQALETGFASFEWMHQTIYGEPIPADVTLVRVVYGEDYVIASYIRDLRGIRAAEEEKHEAEERVRLMFDATPLCCNLWTRDLVNMDCNQEAVNLFELSSKEEYLERFFELSPEYQPDGRLTSEKAVENINKAFETGFTRFEWMHQKLNGEPIPSEITLVRVDHGDDYFVAGYTRDLRSIKAAEEEKRKAEERVRIMFDATPLCCNLWTRDLVNMDCNQEAVELFELSSKEEYLERFFELSPEYQPDGRLTSEKAMENINKAFETGMARFEWMHQKLNGEQIPAEITLVRVAYGDDYVVAGYTRDLREMTRTVNMLSRMEKLAFTDAVTGIPNRRYFMDKASKQFGDIPGEHTISVMMIDLDHFKNINDTYGHMTGDDILRGAASRIQSALRETDCLARYGGEEFVVMLHDAQPRAIANLAERLRRRIADEIFESHGTTISITTSIGVALQSNSSQTLDELIELADKALYKAKQNGRNRVEFA